jgi:hypothetical protein
MAVALAEICIASGVGANVEHEHPFSEDPHRFLVAAEPGTLQLPEDIARRIGTMDGDQIEINGQGVPLDQASAAWHEAIPRALAG